MSTTTQRNILILAPHCDDAEFGLGASIQRWREEGASIHVLIASCSDYARSDGQNVCAKGRLVEARAAFEHIGVNSWKSAGWFKENQALACDYGRLVSQIEGEIRAINPSEVYVCLPSFNQDHRVLYDATMTAFRPGAQIASLYAYEYPGNVWGPMPPESLAGKGSKFPGTVALTDGGSYGDNKWYGRVTKEGAWESAKLSDQLKIDLSSILDQLATQPAQLAAKYGKLTGHCCFCNSELSDEKSTNVGYGPVCAKRWGLPYGKAS